MNRIECTIATAGDEAEVTPLMRAFYAEESLAYSENCAEALRVLLRTPEWGRVGLVKIDGAAGGYFVLTLFFSVERGGRAALLDELYIEPASRGRGVGAAALQFAMELARTLGCSTLHLEVDRANAAARRLYARLGFVDHGREFLTRAL